MDLLRWLIARTVGFPPFREEGGGILSVLKVSKTFRKVNNTRKAGTTKGIVIRRVGYS